MGTPPPGPHSGWYERFYGYRNRPYTGCGCLYALVAFILIWALLALLIPGLWLF